MIRRIAIDNFRCFTNLELLPGRVNLLLGANGSGKSSLFDLLATVVELVRRGASVGEILPVQSLTRWDTRTLQRVELEIEAPQGCYLYTLCVRHWPEKSQSLIEREVVSLEGRTLFAFEDGTVHLHGNDGSRGASFAFRGSRSFLAQIESREETTDLMGFLDFLDQLWLLCLDAPSILGISHTEEPALARDGTNFASWYRHLAQESPERLGELLQAWRSAIPGLASVKLTSAGGQGRVRDLVTTMTTGGATYTIALDELSDGQRALLVLYALLEGFDVGAGCLLLDEPEAHVGLTEVQPWLVELDERLAQGGQVFVISHHPEVVDYLAAAEPFLFERKDAGPVRIRRAFFDRDSGVTASRQLARGLVDGE